MIAMGGMGIWLGASLTTYHRFLPSKKVWHWLLFITDLLFWCVQGLIIFYVLVLVNQGTLRLYLFLAMAIGFSAYKGLFETTYYKILDSMIRFTVVAARFLKKTVILFFVQPLLTLLKLSYRLVKILSRILLGILLFIGTIIYTPIKWLFQLLLFFIPNSWILTVEKWVQQGTLILSKIRTFIIKFLKKWR